MFNITPYTHRQINRYDPFRDLEELERSLFGSHRMSTFETDISDNGDSYLLEADLPGFSKDNINIDINGDRMTISAERKATNEKKDKNDNLIYSERSYGSYSRSFDLGGIDRDRIGAEYVDGVLRVTLPKLEKKTPETRRLEIR